MAVAGLELASVIERISLFRVGQMNMRRTFKPAAIKSIMPHFKAAMLGLGALTSSAALSFAQDGVHRSLRSEMQGATNLFRRRLLLLSPTIWFPKHPMLTKRITLSNGPLPKVITSQRQRLRHMFHSRCLKRISSNPCISKRNACGSRRRSRSLSISRSSLSADGCYGTRNAS